MNDLQKIYSNIREHADEVIRNWRRHTEDEPWLGLPPNAHIDHLPDLLFCIMDVLETGDDETRERVIRTGILHGRHRRENGFEDTLLHHEHHLLRSAVWEVIIDRYDDSHACFQAIARFDAVLTQSTNASLHGYHLGMGSPPLTEDRIVRRLTGEDQPWPPPAGGI